MIGSAFSFSLILKRNRLVCSFFFLSINSSQHLTVLILNFRKLFRQNEMK